MTGICLPASRWQRLLALVVALTLVWATFGTESFSVAARDESLGTPAAEPESSAVHQDAISIPEPGQTPAEIEEEPIVAATESASATEAASATENPTAQQDQATTSPASGGIEGDWIASTVEPAPAETSTASVEPAISAVTDSQSTPAASEPLSVAAADGSLHVVAYASPSNARLPGACVSLFTHSLPHIFMTGGCTGANGEVTLTGGGGGTYDVHITPAPGYNDLEDGLVSVDAGETVEYPLQFTANAIPPGTETFHAVDAITGEPLGGACWDYRVDSGGTGAVLIGPICDDDGDGTVIVPNVPVGRYCNVVTPPAGYSRPGNGTICGDDFGNNRELTVAFWPDSATGGSATVFARTTWGAPIAGACVSAELEDDFGNSAAGGCSGEDGKVALDGLFAGAYVITPAPAPHGFSSPDPVPFTAVAGEAVTIELVYPAISSGSSTLTAVFGSGPDRIPGACWSYAVNDGGQPGIVVVGPQCDDDGDGVETLADLPLGSFCYVVDPPAGYYRPAEDYFLCGNTFGGGGALTVGFLLTATPTSTPTSTPTRTATATPTPTPFGSPAPSEPNGNVLARNCAVSRPSELGTFNSGCQPAPAITLAVIQHGVEIDRQTTGADGTFAVQLPDRTPFLLRYIGGNGEEWAVSTGEETRQRYTESTSFSFIPAPEIDQSWTITVQVVSGEYDTLDQPVGGGCAVIERGQTGEVLLGQVCDDDSDGTIVIGKLPPADAGGYRARLVSWPAGYDPDYGEIGYGVEPASQDFVWTAKIYVRRLYPAALIHTVDTMLQPVPGFCYIASFGDGSLASWHRCDVDDGSNDGITTISPLAYGGNYVIHLTRYAARWQTNTTAKPIAMNLTGDTPITFQVSRYGNDSKAKADLEVATVDQTGRTRFTSSPICYRLWSTTGFFYGEHCADGQESRTIFEDLSVGTYDLTLVTANPEPNCEPGPFEQIAVEVADLGTTVTTTVVMTCEFAKPPPPPCEIQTDTVRHVDVYYGSAIDDQTLETMLKTFELSESIGWTAAYVITLENPDPELFLSANLGQWIEPIDSVSWAGSDWQSDARAALLNLFGQFGDVVVTDENVRLESTQILSSFSEFGEDPSLYPECDAFPGAEWVEITRAYSVALRFIELNVEVSERDATATPTNTPSPAPTATPLPIACTVPQTRDITLVYGSLKDDDGNELRTALELSDHVPSSLAEKLEDLEHDGITGDLVGSWMDPGVDAEEWIAGEPEGLDPTTALRNALSGENVELGTAIEHDPMEIELGSVVTYLDQDALPEGCVVVAWGLLYAVEQPLIANVRIVEINGVQLGTGTAGTSTPTRTPTPSPTSTSISGPTASATTVTGSVDPVRQLPDTGTGGDASNGRVLSWAVALLTAIVLIITTNVRNWSYFAGGRGPRPEDEPSRRCASREGARGADR